MRLWKTQAYDDPGSNTIVLENGMYARITVLVSKSLLFIA